MKRMTQDERPRQWRDWDDFDPEDEIVTRPPRRGRAPSATARRGTGRRRGPLRLLALNILLICLVGGGVLGGLYARGHGWGPQATPTGSTTQTAAGTPLFVHSQDGRVDQADTSCQIIPPAPHMITPEELAHPYTMGRRFTSDGRMHDCIVPGLYVPEPAGGAPGLPGQVILVSVTQQWLWAYQDNKLVYATPVTTGQTYLWTPLGVYHIYEKITDTVFYSPWPPGSPFYYTPEHINYAMLFREKGFYLHDAPWRHAFGPGTEDPHTDPDGTWETGSHGCVNMVTGAAVWLYNWAALGTTVDIVA